MVKEDKTKSNISGSSSKEVADKKNTTDSKKVSGNSSGDESLNKDRKNRIFIVGKKNKNKSKDSDKNSVDGKTNTSFVETDTSYICDLSQSVHDISSANSSNSNLTVANDKHKNKDDNTNANDHQEVQKDEHLKKEAFTGTGGAFFANDKIKDDAPEKDSSELKEEAFTGTGGAFFNNDIAGNKKIDVDEEDKKELKDEAFTGVGGAFFNNDILAKDKVEIKEDEKKKEMEEKAFAGVGGAFFNNDKTNIAAVENDEDNKNDENNENNEDNENNKNNENNAIDTSNTTDNKKVVIDEDNNEIHEIPNLDNNFIFVPTKLKNLPKDSKITEYRNNNKIVAEGHFWKKRWFFYCFWMKRYFTLLNDGTLTYFAEDGSGAPKQAYDIKKATDLSKVEIPNSLSTSRLVFQLEGQEIYFAFDTLDDRDYWHTQFKNVIDGNQK